MAFIGVAIGAIAAAVKASVLLQVLGRIVLSIALSALQRALMPKPREPGIKTKVTQTGGTNPQAFPLLKYATAGTHACPPMSHGSSGKTPNAYLTYVVILSDVPGATLSRWMVNNQYVPLGTTPHADYGLPATGALAGAAWIKVYTGDQVAADPMLIAKYGTYPERPWTSDMIGRGLVYAICTFRYERSLYPGLPRVRFEMNGIPLYDPRKDTTVGGSGAHRWADPATWEASVNPEVGVYNVLRGIELPDGSVYGGGFPAEDIPLASWFAGMNACDTLVSNGVGTEPQFRAGLEVGVDEEPADVIGELLKVCAGNVAEIGGLWKTRVGGPGTPVYNFTDADVVTDNAEDYWPFPNMAGSYNGAHATYPDPAKAWETSEAEPYYNATYEAADQDFRLTADLNLVACPYPAQARRLQYAYVEEERRFRRHQLALPPDAAVVEPLDAVGWTSTENGYTAKVFEIGEVAEDLLTGIQRMMLAERDSADFTYPSLPAPDAISILPVVPGAQTVPSFAVTGVSILDSSGSARRPALELTWEPDLADVTGIMWEVRLQATGVVVARGSTQNVAAGLLTLTEGLVADTAYEVRAKPVVDRPADWTAWIAATTPNTLITSPDIADFAVTSQLQTIVLGPLQKADLSTGAVIATLDMGVIEAGEIWRRGVQFFAKTTSASFPFTVDLQRRRAILGGGFDAWTTTASWSVNTTTYDLYVDSGSIAGTYDDFEYRLQVAFMPAPVGSGVDLMKDVYITLARATK